jgi:hypothetical protein
MRGLPLIIGALDLAPAVEAAGQPYPLDRVAYRRRNLIERLF